MNRTLRYILIGVGVLIVLLIVVPFLIPVNEFRPTIEQKASAALGRKVQLGNLSLSLLSGSLAAENLSIGDDPKFSASPFLTAQSLKVGVEIMPLIFSKTLNVTGVTIDSPQVTLLRNAAGQWNYSSLGGAAAKAQAKQPPAKAPTVTANLPGGGKLKLDGNAGPIDQTDTSLTPLKAKLNVDSLNLASTGFLDPAAGLGGILDLDGTVTSQG